MPTRQTRLFFLTTGKPRCLSTDPACPRFYSGVAGFAFIFAECKTGNRHRTHKAQNAAKVLRFRFLGIGCFA